MTQLVGSRAGVQIRGLAAESRGLTNAPPCLLQPPAAWLPSPVSVPTLLLPRPPGTSQKPWWSLLVPRPPPDSPSPATEPCASISGCSSVPFQYSSSFCCKWIFLNIKWLHTCNYKAQSFFLPQMNNLHQIRQTQMEGHSTISRSWETKNACGTITEYTCHNCTRKVWSWTGSWTRKFLCSKGHYRNNWQNC